MYPAESYTFSCGRGNDWIGSVVHERVTSAVKMVKFARDKVLDVTIAVDMSNIKF